MFYELRPIKVSFYLVLNRKKETFNFILVTKKKTLEVSFCLEKNDPFEIKFLIPENKQKSYKQRVLINQF